MNYTEKLKACQQWFIQHPHDQQMTYWTHMKRAWSLAFTMGKGCLALFVHGVCPEWFKSFGSDTIKSLYYEVVPKSPPPIVLNAPTLHRIPPLETS